MLALLQRIAYYRPRVLALNSFTIWSDIASQLTKKERLQGVSFKAPAGLPKPSLKLPQRDKKREPCFLPWKIVYEPEPGSTLHITETLIIPLPGTSGANASYSVRNNTMYGNASLTLAFSLRKRSPSSRQFMMPFQ